MPGVLCLQALVFRPGWIHRMLLVIQLQRFQMVLGSPELTREIDDRWCTYCRGDLLGHNTQGVFLRHQSWGGLICEIHDMRLCVSGGMNGPNVCETGRLCW